MGPEAAVNAVYYNKIQEKPEAERAAYVEKLRDEYRADIDLEQARRASSWSTTSSRRERLRDELIRRFAFYRARPEDPLPAKKRGIRPV